MSNKNDCICENLNTDSKRLYIKALILKSSYICFTDHIIFSLFMQNSPAVSIFNLV